MQPRILLSVGLKAEQFTRFSVFPFVCVAQ